MATSTSTSNFSQAKVDAYIRKKLLELGPRKYIFRKFVNKERIEKGHGTTWKALRYKRLDVPLAALTEGVAPTETDLDIEYLTATATQYGITVKITDVLQMTINHPVLQKAIELKSDVMATLDDKLLQEKAVAGTNVYYGGTATARSGLSAAGADVLTTSILRKAVQGLRSTDGVKGKAPSNSNGGYVGIIHERQIFDIQADTDWKNMAYRLDKADLESGMINKWAGVEWYATNFLFQFHNLANSTATNPTGFGTYPDLAENTAVTTTRGMNGFKKDASNAAGTLTASMWYAVVLTRKHKKRGLEEGITSVLSAATGVGETQIIFTMPTDADYVYSLYFDTAARASAAAAQAVAVTSLARVANNVAAASVQTVTALPAAGVTPPVAPPRSGALGSVASELIDVFPSFILGGDALAVVDLDDLKSYVTHGPDSGNPLDQFVIVGSKFMLGAAILQDSFMARSETQSAFG